MRKILSNLSARNSLIIQVNRAFKKNLMNTINHEIILFEQTTNSVFSL